jgi:hypothetical protein
MPKKINKIFGIGLSRTGTSSLNQALIRLGFKSVHYPPIKHLFNVMEKYDAATDTTVAVKYKELDKKYPNSKFILTIRDVGEWLDSCKWFFSREKAQRDAQRRQGKPILSQQQLFIRRYLYGNEFFDEESYREGFLLFLKDAQLYFKNRPDDLLVMNIAKGDGFNVLCPFLGVPTINKPFPHLHYKRTWKK